MGKLLKYKLKSMYKFILMVLLTIVLSSTILQINVFRISQANFSGMENEVPGFGLFLMILAGVVIWAVFLVSLELDEVMNVPDRILVIYEGEIVGDLDPKTITVEELGLYMSGAKRDVVKEIDDAG